jgi:aminoglycoside 6'-N-acetyltransferase
MLFTFRPMVRDDLELLRQWLAEPHIARWWNITPDPEVVAAKYGPRMAPGSPTAMWIVEVDGAPAGVLQSYRHRDYPEHDAAVGIADACGIDYFLSVAYTGRGVGGRMLRAAAEHVLAIAPDCTCCVATPAQENVPSWRALERAGFERVCECQPPDEPPAYAYAYWRT